MANLTQAPDILARFSGDLDRLVEAGMHLGIAVSGGPDSLALLLLAAAARPGQIEAATVDHALRPESRAEADFVRIFCKQLGIPHAILTAQWDQKPETALQERARSERYRLLGVWTEERGLSALLTAHHADDQAETLLMRLNRGCGVRGLAAMRAARRIRGLQLIRPLLSWRRAELEEICAAAGIEPVRDPSNEDERFERVRVRNALADADWLNPEAVARSADHLAEADTALDWASEMEWQRAVRESEHSILYSTCSAPAEIVRRIVVRAIGKLASEGEGDLRGAEIDRLLDTLAKGSTATIRGVLCSGGGEWRFSPAPKRRS